MSFSLAVMLFSSKAVPPKGSVASQTAPPSGDRVFKHKGLHGMFSFKLVQAEFFTALQWVNE